MSADKDRDEEERDLQTRADVLALRWSMDRLEHTLQETSTRLQAVADRMETTYVRKDVYDGDQRGVWDKLKEHAGWLLWAQRLVMLAVFGALLGTVLVKGG